MEKPGCLHIPPLYQDDEAFLFWHAMDGAAAYRLECAVDGDFETAQTGLEWGRFDDAGKSWDVLDNTTSWDEIDVWDNRGRTWSAFESDGLSWDEMDTRPDTWQDVSEHALDLTVYAGPGTNHTIPAADGMNWDARDARWSPWSEADARALSWDAIEQQPPDTGPHLGCTVQVPVDKQSGMYRVNAAAQAAVSGYLTALQQAMISVDTTEVQMPVGELYHVNIVGELVRNFEGMQFTLYYDPLYLAFNAVSLHAAGTPATRTRIVRYTEGQVVFECDAVIPTWETQDGLVLNASFRVVRPGEATLRLERASRMVHSDKPAPINYALKLTGAGVVSMPFGLNLPSNTFSRIAVRMKCDFTPWNTIILAYETSTVDNRNILHGLLYPNSATGWKTIQRYRSGIIYQGQLIPQYGVIHEYAVDIAPDGGLASYSLDGQPDLDVRHDRFSIGGNFNLGYSPDTNKKNLSFYNAVFYDADGNVYAEYDFQDGSGDIVADKSGHGRHASISGPHEWMEIEE